jgi:drug/metabolite transporter (DMT)-like permease
MRVVRAGRAGLTTGAGVAALLVLFVMLSSMLVRGEVPSAFDLVVLAAIVLGVGLLLRWRGTGRSRTLGSILVIVGIVSLAIVLGLIWLLLQGLGRPY